MKCALYCRVSTEEQAVGGHSIEAQRQELMKYCEAFNYEVYDFYIDAGFSAGTMERPALHRMLKDADNYDIALVWRLDRISRDMSDLMKILDIFQSKHVAFKSKMESFDTSTASGKLMLNMLGSFAEFERASISDRIKMAHRKILNEGKWRGGVAPYGYKNTEEKTIEIIEEEACAIRLIFDMSANKNIGARSIALEMNRLGYRTRGGKGFESPYVSKLLKNPTYCGEMIYGRQKYIKKDGRKQAVYARNFATYKGIYEPIVSRELFIKSAHNMESRKANRGISGSIPNLLGGLVYCGDCKGHMLRNTGRNGDKYFVCGRYKQSGECTHHYISENRILNEIKKFTANIELKRSEILEINKRLIQYSQQQATRFNGEIEKLRKRYQGYTSREDKLFSLIEKGLINEDEFISRKGKLTEQKLLIEHTLENLDDRIKSLEDGRAKSDFIENIKVFSEESGRLSLVDRKRILETLIERIEVMDNEKPYGRKKIHIYFKI